MTTKTKIYIAAAIAAIFAIGTLGRAAWSERKIATLENSVGLAKQEAESSDQLAARREIEAAAYKQKIDYLESQLSEIQTIARKQDEELEKLSADSAVARGNAGDARRTRTIAATADELCAKLAELGHPCS